MQVTKVEAGVAIEIATRYKINTIKVKEEASAKTSKEDSNPRSKETRSKKKKKSCLLTMEDGELR